MSDFYGVTDLQKAIAGKIREVVRLRIGPNSRDILDAGGSVALTPSECEEAAATALATALSEGYAIVTKEEAAKAKAFDEARATVEHLRFCRFRGEQFKPCALCLLDEMLAKHSPATESKES